MRDIMRISTYSRKKIAATKGKGGKVMGSAVLGEAISAIRDWSGKAQRGATGGPHAAETFGSLVFNDSVQQARLPKTVYQALRRTITHGDPLDAAARTPSRRR